MAYSLKLFGGVSLEVEDSAVTGSAAQRHRLALLALLAASPSRSLSRDRLMAFLWPDRDADRARKLLNQAVYALRGVLGDEAILSVNDELRLNAGAGRCDLIAFEEALAADPEGAIGLYAGPFLDGFFLRDAPEFEHWVDQERARLADSYAGALERAAAAAEAAGDLGRALAWWKARATQDPYDSRVALRLMQAYEADGNVAGALQHASIHERMLEEELGLPLPTAVATVVQRLHRRPSDHAPLTEPPGTATTTPPAVSPAAAPVSEPAALPVSLPAPRPGRRLRHFGRYGTAVLLAGALMFGAIRLVPTRANARVEQDLSIAVLPFRNLSTDPEDAILADAMTDELITMLAKVGGVRVTPSTSVAAFRDEPTDVRIIADRLRVSSIIEGGVQKSGSRIRVQVRLVDALDGATRWSERYDRELRDVFAVQDEIGRAVAGALGLRLGLSAATALVRQPTQSVAAYELYLRGSDPTLIRNDSTALDALEYFRQAIALDSTYAAAYAGLARIYLRVRGTMRRGTAGTPIAGLAGASPQDLLAAAEAAALKAIELDAELAEAQAALGLVRMNMNDIASAEPLLQRAIAIDPGRARYHEWLVGLYDWTGRAAEALAAAERALELDPLSPTAHAELARALLLNDRCDEALARLDALAALEPPLLRASTIAVQCYAKKQMWPEAVEAMRRQPGNPHSRALLVHLLARSGQREEALDLHAGLLDAWEPRGGGADAIAIAYAGLGDLDQAFAWIERAIDDGSLRTAPGMARIMAPMFEDLHRDPRFADVRTRLGLQNR